MADHLMELTLKNLVYILPFYHSHVQFINEEQ